MGKPQIAPRTGRRLVDEVDEPLAHRARQPLDGNDNLRREKLPRRSSYSFCRRYQFKPLIYQHCAAVQPPRLWQLLSNSVYSPTLKDGYTIEPQVCGLLVRVRDGVVEHRVMRELEERVHEFSERPIKPRLDSALLLAFNNQADHVDYGGHRHGLTKSTAEQVANAARVDRILARIIAPPAPVVALPVRPKPLAVQNERRAA
jgi:hypothetical protein